jgi:hypothetical protein
MWGANIMAESTDNERRKTREVEISTRKNQRLPAWHKPFSMFAASNCRGDVPPTGQTSWFGATASKLGSSLTTVALPLVAVLALHANTFVVAALIAAEWIPSTPIASMNGSALPQPIRDSS